MAQATDDVTDVVVVTRLEYEPNMPVERVKVPVINVVNEPIQSDYRRAFLLSKSSG